MFGEKERPECRGRRTALPHQTLTSRRATRRVVHRFDSIQAVQQKWRFGRSPRSGYRTKTQYTRRNPSTPPRSVMVVKIRMRYKAAGDAANHGADTVRSVEARNVFVTEVGEPRDLLIVGAGGFSREAAEAVRAAQAHGGPLRLVGFVDDDESLAGTLVDGIPVVGGVGHIRSRADVSVVVGVGRPERAHHPVEDRGSARAGAGALRDHRASGRLPRAPRPFSDRARSYSPMSLPRPRCVSARTCP